MESKVNYTVVGLFVFVLLAATIVVSLWLSFGLSHKQYNTYQINMNESVAGLSIDSPVQFNGVTVGHVEYISLNRHNPQQVNLLLDIETDIPITEGTTATLMSQGMTGIAYIGLRNNGDMTPLHILPGEHYPIIRTTPSLMMRLDTVITTLSMNLNDVSKELQAILDLENRQAIKETLQNLNQVSAMLAANTEQMNQTLKSTNVFMENAAKASQQFPMIFRDSQNVMRTLNERTLPMFNQILMNFGSTANNFSTLSNEIKQNPSILLRGATPPPPGPGEH